MVQPGETKLAAPATKNTSDNAALRLQRARLAIVIGTPFGARSCAPGDDTVTGPVFRLTFSSHGLAFASCEDAGRMASVHGVRFGAFEFSFDAHKLRKDGHDVPGGAASAPAGNVAAESRQGRHARRIQQRLWRDTHVDFDRSVDAALNRLRAALGDNGKQPRLLKPSNGGLSIPRPG